MDLVLKLIKGNTYEEYEALFTKAGLMDDEININITTVIDFTLCNAGSITSEEAAIVRQSLRELIYTYITPEYAEVIKEVLKEIQERITVPEPINRIMQRLQRKLK